MAERMQPIPEVLRERAEYAPFSHRVGDWEIAIPQSPNTINGVFPMAWVWQRLNEFNQAFPWAKYREMAIATTKQAPPLIWKKADGGLKDWLDVLAAGGVACRSCNFEVLLDLRLWWQLADGSYGESVFPKVGQLSFSPSFDRLSVVIGTFTIWLNAFVREVTVSEEQEAPLFEVFDAGRKNRARLRASLMKWEKLTGGQITNWSSEILEEGMERCGFAEEAKIVYY